MSGRSNFESWQDWDWLEEACERGYAVPLEQLAVYIQTTMLPKPIRDRFAELLLTYPKRTHNRGPKYKLLTEGDVWLRRLAVRRYRHYCKIASGEIASDDDVAAQALEEGLAKIESSTGLNNPSNRARAYLTTEFAQKFGVVTGEATMKALITEFESVPSESPHVKQWHKRIEKRRKAKQSPVNV